MPTRRVQLGNVIGAGVTRANASIERLTVNANFAGNTPYWIGVYTTTLNSDGSIAAPQAGAVPVIEYGPINNAGEAEYLLNKSSIAVPGPVWAGLSSTENSYTAQANTARIDIDIDEYELPPSGLTSVNNTAGTVNKVTIWASSSSSPHLLYDVFAQDLNNSAGAQLYLMLFAAPIANVVNGALPVQEWEIPISGTQGVNTTATGSLYLNFGRTGPNQPFGGLAPFQQGIPTTANQPTTGNLLGQTGLYTGCVLAISTTPGSLTLGASNAAYITGRYI